MIAILPYEPWHRAMLPVRSEQADDLVRMGQAADLAAAHGPAFSAVEQDADGNVVAVLACAGLAENTAEHATAWAAFAEGLRAAQWTAITHAIRAVIEGAHYRRVDMLVRADWPTAQRYAEALGFSLDGLIYARVKEAA
jgi:hypothetical protein